MSVPARERRRVSTLARLAVLAVLGAAALPLDARAAPPAPFGAQLQVNDVVVSGQDLPDVARDAAGNFVVVWESFTSAGNDADRSIQARRFRADGSPLGPQFQVNTQVFEEQAAPAVAMAPDGQFTVAWEAEGEAGGPKEFDIRARRFLATGAPAGPDFLVNTEYRVDQQRHPDVAWAGALGFMVVWESDDDPQPTGQEWNVVGRVYDATGAPATGELQLNTLSEVQLDPAVAGHPSGNFVVAWESFTSGGTDETTSSIQVLLVGSPPEAQVNQHPPVANDDNPAVAVAPNGDILVAWETWGSVGNDASRASVQARFYGDGGPGPVFQANAYTDNDQRFPSVALLPDSRFVIGWQSWGSFGDDASDHSVQLRAFGADGIPLASEQQVNSYADSFQGIPALAVDADGEIVAVWTSFGSPGDDDSGSSIQARRLSLDLLFHDGFESGDFTRWSAAHP
jgi:hypothetical protein